MSVIGSADHGPPSVLDDARGVHPLAVAAAVIVGMLIAAGAVYLWQSAKVSEARTVADLVRTDLSSRERDVTSLRAEVSALRDERARLQDDAATLQARVEHLVVQAGGLESAVGTLNDSVDRLTAQLEAARSDLERAEARAIDARERLKAAHERVVVAAGLALADGRYAGWIQGVDSTGSPQRLAMRVTARASGGVLAHPGWRVFAVASGASVELTTYKGGRDVTMGLGRFEHIFDGTAEWNAEMRTKRYWIRLVAGRVVALGEIDPRR